MKAVILAGGLGSRISEETTSKPKPMVEIGGRPILWHIMKIYSAHGIHDFVVCCGYRGYVIKEYFANYYLHTCDVTFDIERNTSIVHHSAAEPWRVTLVDTGDHSNTGGRLKRAAAHLGDEPFCFTYGDGLGDVNIRELVNFHERERRAATMTVVQPPGRFGAVHIDGSSITSFREKPEGDGGWINGGFFVLSPQVLDLIDSDATVWEQQPLQHLAADKNLSAYMHRGFWHPMDTLRDKVYLDKLWETGAAPWKIWD